jgi:hypothetical protein
MPAYWIEVHQRKHTHFTHTYKRPKAMWALHWSAASCCAGFYMAVLAMSRNRCGIARARHTFHPPLTKIPYCIERSCDVHGAFKMHVTDWQCCTACKNVERWCCGDFGRAVCVSLAAAQGTSSSTRHSRVQYRHSNWHCR